MTLPMFPDSEVPRARITVRAVQPVLVVMSVAEEPEVYLLLPPVLGAGAEEGVDEDVAEDLEALVVIGRDVVVGVLLGVVVRMVLMLVDIAVDVGAFVVEVEELQGYVKPKKVQVPRFSSSSAGWARTAVARATKAEKVENFHVDGCVFERRKCDKFSQKDCEGS